MLVPDRAPAGSCLRSLSASALRARRCTSTRARWPPLPLSPSPLIPPPLPPPTPSPRPPPPDPRMSSRPPSRRRMPRPLPPTALLAAPPAALPPTPMPHRPRRTATPLKPPLPMPLLMATAPRPIARPRRNRRQAPTPPPTMQPRPPPPSSRNPSPNPNPSPAAPIPPSVSVTPPAVRQGQATLVVLAGDVDADDVWVSIDDYSGQMVFEEGVGWVGFVPVERLARPRLYHVVVDTFNNGVYSTTHLSELLVEAEVAVIDEIILDAGERRPAHARDGRDRQPDPLRAVQGAQRAAAVVGARGDCRSWAWAAAASACCAPTTAAPRRTGITGTTSARPPAPSSARRRAAAWSSRATCRCTARA